MARVLGSEGALLACCADVEETASGDAREAVTLRTARTARRFMAIVSCEAARGERGLIALLAMRMVSGDCVYGSAGRSAGSVVWGEYPRCLQLLAKEVEPYV